MTELFYTLAQGTENVHHGADTKNLPQFELDYQRHIYS